MSRITIKNTYLGSHRWKDAIDEVQFLANDHAHDFKVEVSCDVRHEDRELEFYLIRKDLDVIVDRLFDKIDSIYRFGDLGCEQIGSSVLEQLVKAYGSRSWSVGVWENEQQGATTYEKDTEVVCDMSVDEYRSIIKKARKIFEERISSYGNSVNEIDTHTIVGLMRMKLYRIYNEGLTAKAEDELLDTINYAVFALSRINDND